jgi:hypothetical protein
MYIGSRNASDALRITDAGNVGIGVTPFTNTIGKSLDLANGGGIFAASNNFYLTGNAYFDAAWKYKATGGAASINVNAGGDGNIGFVTAASGTINTTIAFTERMRITSGGYAKMSSDGTYNNATGSYHEMVQTTTGEVTARFKNKSGSPYGLLFDFSGTAPNNGTNYFVAAGDTGAYRFFLYSNGGLANFQANNTNLSDERTKKEIFPLESYWNKFKAIEIVKFKYKDQTHDDFNIGVIAQQVEEVAPEFVDIDGWDNGKPKNEDEEEIISTEEPLKSVYTSDLHHATIKVLQEAMAKIEILEEEVKLLKAK